MNLAEIEANVGELDLLPGEDFIFALLAAYGHPKASVTRLRKGSLNKAGTPGDVLWAKKVLYRHVGDGRDPHDVIDDLMGAREVIEHSPRFVIVTNTERILARDMSTGVSLDVGLDELSAHADFFMPWAGFEKVELEAAHYADIKAAEKMAQLYDEIRKANDVDTDKEIHELNVFFVRLLFCFFAEDTGVFEQGQFTRALASLTLEDGSDLRGVLERLFEVLGTPVADRAPLPAYLSDFDYVGGSLFAERTGTPAFSGRARSIILQSGELDWSEINPDIFGSMMQAVVRASTRSEVGMHYTSLDNILRVLRPLLFEELELELSAAEGNEARLRRILDRLARVRVLDPACGSGNFLVVAYRELRMLEMRALEQLRTMKETSVGSGLFDVSRIELTSFGGIEIDDFAAEVARLSLWIAKHQANRQHADRFGAFPPLIPLVQQGRIHCGNAVGEDWMNIFPHEPGTERFICGNPPYVGSSMQTRAQKLDMEAYFGDESFSRNLDYVSLWILKSADCVASSWAVRAGLVATSSVCQGDHVALMFPKLFSRGVELGFAHTPFKWGNGARGNAGVACVVLGLRAPSPSPAFIFSEGRRRAAGKIGPYLIEDQDQTVVQRARVPISGLPPMQFGNKPTDGGHLILSPADRERMLDEVPAAAPFIRPYLGAAELLSGEERYCLWIEDHQVDAAMAIDPIRARLEAVTTARRGPGSSSVARSFAERPHRFVQRCHQESPAILVPGVTSERRHYVPMAYVGPAVIASNALYVIFGAEPHVFALLQSRLHTIWLETVGGRLETRFRYSSDLVYGTFPAPSIAGGARQALGESAMGILAARERHPRSTLEELYDPGLMPADLAAAHEANDVLVAELFGFPANAVEPAMQSLLLSLYRDLVSKEGVKASA